MANIIPLQEDTGAQFYPQTHVKAVIDSEGNTLDEILENLEPGGATNAVKYTPQTLTTAQKTQARTNIDAPSTADVSGKQDTLVSGTNIKTVNGESLLGSGNIVAGDPNAVKYTSQTLTDAQKAQARTNIGAGTYSKPSGGIPASDLASGVIPSEIDTVNVTVDNNTGTPSATASVSGSTLSLAFQNLKGTTGATGPQGPVGPKGEQGNPGSSVDYPFTLANNLETNDSTVALAAPQGIVLDNKINNIANELVFNLGVGTWEIGTLGNVNNGHIPDVVSNRRVRTEELTIVTDGVYTIRCNNNFRFSIMVVGKQESLSWLTEQQITLERGDIYRFVLRQEPDPSDTNIYSGWTQAQVDALVESSGFNITYGNRLNSLEQNISSLEDSIDEVLEDQLTADDYSIVEVGEVWPPRIEPGYANGLVFYLDGKDFVAGSPWVDKIGSISFTMEDCARDGDGVRFNGSTSKGYSSGDSSFPSQQYTIEMVVKAEKEVASANDAQAIFIGRYSGDFGLGYGYTNNHPVFANQVDQQVANLGYNVPSFGLQLFSLNKDVAVFNGTTLLQGGVVKWNTPSNNTIRIGSTASGSLLFKGVIYAIRIYNRLLTASEMMANQNYDLQNYDLQ